MSDKKLVCVILAAGLGTRMKSDMPKALHKIAGLPMLGWVIRAAEELGPAKIIVVTGPDMEEVAAASGPHRVVIQQRPLGTADAVKAALPELSGFDGDVLVLLSDMPLLSAGMMRGVIETRREGKDTGIAVLGVKFSEDNIPPFGRLVMDSDNCLERIIEDKDCTPEQRSINLCNTGAICIDGTMLENWLERVTANNAQGEFYLTSLPEIAAQDGAKTRIAVLYDSEEATGVNSRADLARMEAIMQQKLRLDAMIGGATLLAPETVYFSHDTELGRDVVIEPGVFFGPGVTVDDHVHIKAYSHLEGAHIESGAVIGPFARLRPGAQIGEGSRVGNFVEVKNAALGKGVKANHLAYIGDAQIGDDVNFSCGVITVNYDGFEKHKTVIGAGAFIGCNANLIAPIEIGAGALIAAGSTIAKNVPPDALAVAREKPLIKEGWAAARRRKKAG